MSALVGIVRFDGAPVARPALTKAMDALAPFARDGRYVWMGDGAAFGYLSLQVTPEDAFERQPTVGAGGAVLMFAGRVDNREDLARTLGLRDSETTPDSAFVLAAYERFGQDFPREIVGDFAAAVWDPRNRQLILARDPCGLHSSLFYAATPEFLAFATLPAGLFPFGIPREVNDLRVAQILYGASYMDVASSPYANVLRLLPGHRLVVRPSSLRVERFFEFDVRTTLRLGSDDAYVEAFVEAYERAVKAQIRAAGPIGMLMSSGRDSASVAALAARQLEREGRRIHAFTWAPEPGLALLTMPGCTLDESELAVKVASQYPAIDHHVYRAEGRTMMDVLAWQKPPFELPTPVSNLVWMDAGIEAASQRGIRVMLTGQYGNASVSWDGAGWLAALARHGRLIKLVTELRRHARASGLPTHVALRRQVIAPLFPGLPDLSRRLRGEETEPRPLIVARPLLEELRKLHGWPPRWRSSYPPSMDGREERANIYLTFQSDAITARLGAYGVESRDPTSDRRLRELSLAIPEEQHVRDGRGIQLLRRGLRGMLPEEILEGPKLGRQGGDFRGRFERAIPSIRAKIAHLKVLPVASRYYDWRAVEALLVRQQTLSSPAALQGLATIGQALSVGTFLETFA